MTDQAFELRPPAQGLAVSPSGGTRAAPHLHSIYAPPTQISGHLRLVRARTRAPDTGAHTLPVRPSHEFASPCQCGFVRAAFDVQRAATALEGTASQASATSSARAARPLSGTREPHQSPLRTSRHARPIINVAHRSSVIPRPSAHQSQAFAIPERTSVGEHV